MTRAERRRGVLASILASKRAEIARMIAGPPPVGRRRPSGDVFTLLRRSAREPLRIIAEVKLRSPSAGALSAVLAPNERALKYAEAGAAMISVLVDRPFFGGSYDDLARCRDALDETLGSRRPRLLCKEFVLHPIQLVMAASSGADAALLIARLTTPEHLDKLHRSAMDLGLEPLVEVTTEAELDIALSIGARIIGVNARDLDTLVMDQARAERVLARIDAARARVHLSGLSSPEDIARVDESRADAALIGEALMRQDDPGPLLGRMLARISGRCAA